MIPKLYSPGEFVTMSGTTIFQKSFVGVLSDAVSCKVTRAIDSEYTYVLEMKYPVGGSNYSAICIRAVISAKPDDIHEPQLFQIYRITTPINGIVTVYAQHISYMLASIPVPAFTKPYGAEDSLKGLQVWSDMIVNHSFTISLDPDSDIAKSEATMELTLPRSVRSALVGSEGSFVDTFGGELDFDGFNVTVYDKLGKDSGTKIKYGVNMTEFEHDENLTTVYTGIYPYATYTTTNPAGEILTNVVTVPSHIMYASDDPPFKKIKVVDLTSKFTDSNGVVAEITPDNLYEAAQEYISENQWGISSVNIKLSFVSLAQTEEYKGVIGIEEISLGDTVSVEYAAVGITASARCVKTVYDVLAEKYDSLEIGKVKKSIIDTLAGMRRDINRLRRR